MIIVFSLPGRLTSQWSQCIDFCICSQFPHAHYLMVRVSFGIRVRVRISVRVDVTVMCRVSKSRLSQNGGLTRVGLNPDLTHAVG